MPGVSIVLAVTAAAFVFSLIQFFISSLPGYRTEPFLWCIVYAFRAAAAPLKPIADLLPHPYHGIDGGRCACVVEGFIPRSQLLALHMMIAVPVYSVLIGGAVAVTRILRRFLRVPR